MARKLTQEQKRILDTRVDYMTLAYDDIRSDVRRDLERINDYETLWSDVERYLWDKNVEAKYNR